MTRALILAALLALSIPLAAEPLTQADHRIIMAFAQAIGVPPSVADRLQIEEAGDPLTGAWGDTEAIGPVGADGSRSRGLYGISMRWQAYLVGKYFPHDPAFFDWRDPVQNAVVGLGYLAALHKRFGTWELALIYYNLGRVTDVPDAVRAYSRRICDWPGTR